MAKITYIVRSSPAGDPEASINVDVETAGGSPLDTLATDSNGLATYEVDGSPGPVVATATAGGRTIARDGRSQDQMGTWTPYDFPGIVRALGNGVVAGYDDAEISGGTDMRVTPGTGLQVLVGVGQIILDGHRYRCSASTALTIGANSSGSTRVDRVVARLTREGQATEGAFVLAVKAGTPGAGAPALTTSDATVEFSLATVTVINGASSFTSGDITDERFSTTLNQNYFPAFPAALRAGDVFYVDATGKIARIAKGTDGQLLKLVSGIPSWVTQSFAVIVQENDVVVDSNVGTFDFKPPFHVISSPSGEANLYITDGGITATMLGSNSVTTAKITDANVTTAKIADGNITNAKITTGIDAAKLANGTVSNTELQYIGTLTSDAQTQLDGKSATTHTHTLTTPPTGFATKSYGATNVTSTATDGVEILGFDIDIPTGGAVFFSQGGGQVNAPASPGTKITLGIKIGSQATDWGMENQTESGERPALATSTRTYASGASAQRVSLRAKVDGGTGTVNAAHINGFGLTTRVPAS